MHRKYKYVFTFPDRKFSVDLHGKSIKQFWNDTYDGLHLFGKMTVERLDGQDLNIKEVKKLFDDLLENMLDDMSAIGARFHNLKKVEFFNLGDSHLNDLLEHSRDEQNESSDDLEDDDFIIEVTKDISYGHFERAEREFQRLKLEKISRYFTISDAQLLTERKYWEIRYCMEKFSRFKDNEQENFYRLYDVIEKVKNSSDYNDILIQSNLTDKRIKKVTRILNNPSIEGSRHEGKGIKTRKIQKDELKQCDMTIRKLINGWIKLKFSVGSVELN